MNVCKCVRGVLERERERTRTLNFTHREGGGERELVLELENVILLNVI